MNSDLVSAALQNTGVVAAMLGEDDRLSMIASLRAEFEVDVTAPSAWNGAAASEGHQQSEGWALIPAFVGASACLMFLEGARRIWTFRNGAELLQVLRECPTFEFYVCDEAPRYLLCCNHHDFVIGWGEAKRWVQTLVEATR